MKAVVFLARGGPEVVEIREIPDPKPSRGEVLVRVRAAALNRADLLQRRGLYPPPPGTREDVPGLELAGEVAALGEGVVSWKPGDRVMAIVAGEAQAELAVVHERMLMRIPDGLSFEEAGTLPEAGITAHDAMFTLGGLRPGWPVLIHAIGSGVSTMAVQIAKAAGAITLGTSRTSGKLEQARALGLDHAILVDKEQPKFAEEVRRITGKKGVPLVIDFVGAPYAAENLACLATGGSVIGLGLMGGPRASINLGMLLESRGRLVGSVLRPRPLDEKIRATQDFAQDILPLIALGRVKPVLDTAMPMAQVREAQERLERNESFGKLVLLP